MPEVEIKKGESVDRALKRLKNKLEAEGILDDMRRLRAFETPAVRLRRKQRAAAKKSRMRFRANLQVFRHEKVKKAEEAAASAAAASLAADKAAAAAEAASS